MIEEQTLRFFIKSVIEREAHAAITVDERAIAIAAIGYDALWFKSSEVSQGKVIDLLEQINGLWIASYWSKEQHRGVQLLISSSPFWKKETGEIFCIETWWPLFEEPKT